MAFKVHLRVFDPIFIKLGRVERFLKLRRQGKTTTASL
jgi:hypothetical protein